MTFQLAPASVALASFRVLVLEDNSQASSLGSGGATPFNLSRVNQLQDALTALETRPFDLIVIDSVAFYSTCKRVQELLKKRKQDVAVVALAPMAIADQIRELIMGGVSDVLIKPVQQEVLINTLRNTLLRRKLTQDNTLLHEQLAQAEKMQKFLSANSPDIVYMLDSNGRFTFVNDNATRLLNQDRQQLIGQHFSTLTGEDQARQLPYAFNERRTGDRKTRNKEMQLKKRLGFDPVNAAKSLSVPFEVSSVGMYEQVPGTGKTRFTGTFGVARDISTRKQAESMIRFQVYHDQLTGLPNRTLFRDRCNTAISQAKRLKHKVVLLTLDIDRFKIINDTLGHQVGDQVLQNISRRLQGCLRESDTLARFGGDEFVILLPQAQSFEESRIVAEKILDALQAPIDIDQQPLSVTASIGIAHYPDHGEVTDTLIRNADIAMNHVKAHGKNGHRHFESKLQDTLSRRMAMEMDLRIALQENQFYLGYQPLVDSDSGELVGIEALIRWQHPRHGLLMPVDFLEVAEESGIIIKIGEWVFNRVCEDLQRWNNPAIKVSINVSPSHVEHAQFVPMVLDTLRRYDIEGKQIEIEITESLLLRHHPEINEKLNLLSHQGICIAIDDFGTGYSSLSYLHRFPISTLKMDRFFIERIDTQGKDACIVKAIISMAQGLNLRLVAEGVETEQQYRYLRNAGCTMMQGFLFSEAISGDALEQLAASARRTDMTEEVAG